MKKEIPSEALDLKAMLLITLLALFWGGNSPAVKIALRDMSPLILAGLRFTLAAIAIWIWAISRRSQLALKPDELLPVGILGMILAAQISAFTIGTHLSLANRGVLLINTHPFFVAVLAHFFIPSDRLTVRKVVGLLVAFFGILLFFRENFVAGNTSYLLGDLILVISAMLLAIQSIYVKKVVQRINPIKLLLWQITFALIPFYAMSFIFEEPSQWKMTWNVAGALMYQGVIVGGFCYFTWTTLIKKYSASKMSAFMFTTPIFGVALSFLILGEEISLWFGVAIVLVASGIYIVNSAKS